MLTAGCALSWLNPNPNPNPDPNPNPNPDPNPNPTPNPHRNSNPNPNPNSAPNSTPNQVRALVTYVSAGDELEIQEEGAWAIASLASNEAHAAHIVETGGLQLLLTLLSSPSGAVRLQVRTEPG